MTASQDDSYERLARYAAGEATESERAVVERQLADDPEMARLLALTGTSRKPVTTEDIDVEAALMAVHAHIDAENTASTASAANTERNVISIDAARTHTRRPAYIPMMRAAAAILVVAGGLAVWRMTSPKASVPASTYATATGESRDVQLADGSAVHLGPASTLTVAADFDRARTVQLDGIAQFTVQHDASHPFTVHAGNADVEDIGTVFTVRMDAAGSVGVAVSAGSVKLRSTRIVDAGAILRAGDRGNVMNAVARAEPGTATAADVSWTTGVLTFEDATLDRVGSDLHRWFGVEAVIDATVSTRHLTATFDHEPIEQIMRTIGLALDAPVVRRGDTVFIGGRR